VSAGDRSQCPKTFHGTYNAYLYGCRCDDAREVSRLYVKRWRHGTQPPATVPVVGSMRRVRALMRIGYAPTDLAQRIGRHPKTMSEVSLGSNLRVQVETHRRIVRIYDELSMTPGPSLRAVAWAARRGYPPPLCWSDETIDDPSAVPEGVRRSFHSKRSHSETAEEYTHFKSLGMSDHAIARALGLRPDSLSQALLRARRAAA
jgi:hypothetical protein